MSDITRTFQKLIDVYGHDVVLWRQSIMVGDPDITVHTRMVLSQKQTEIDLINQVQQYKIVHRVSMKDLIGTSFEDYPPGNLDRINFTVGNVQSHYTIDHAQPLYDRDEIIGFIIWSTGG